MPAMININPTTSQFFIAISKQDVHSFIMLGIYDGTTVRQLLCRVGKVMVAEPGVDYKSCLTLTSMLANLCFSSNKADLKDEVTSRPAIGNKPISYQAYDISYAQYLEFVRMLESLQNEKNKFQCFKPVQQNGDNIDLSLTSDIILTPKATIDGIKKSITNLHLGNTCRHTAIDLVEEVQQAPVSSMVSSTYFYELPCTTVLKFGQPSTTIPFYVMPVSPAAYPNLGDKQRQVVETIYKRMEQMLLIDPYSPQTQTRFLSLKKLYLDQLGPQKKLSLEAMLLSIRSWKQENKSDLMVLRKKYFWDYFFTRQTATMKMVNSLEDDLLKTLAAQ